MNQDRLHDKPLPFLTDLLSAQRLDIAAFFAGVVASVVSVDGVGFTSRECPSRALTDINC